MRSRLLIGVIVLGGVLLYFGFQEFRVSADSSAEPVAVSLADLEKGNPPPNNHIRIGPHVRLYGGSVCEYEQSKYSTAKPGPDTKVNHVYYPALSDEHPFLAKLASVGKLYGGIDRIPDDKVPPIEGLAVLVKTKRFKTIGAIPEQADASDSLKGLIINRIESLKADEKRLLSEGFPNVDFSKVLILEEDREPSSSAKFMGFLGGGAILALAGLAGLVLPWLRNRETSARSSGSPYDP
jgi:hypothetical protein